MTFAASILRGNVLVYNLGFWVTWSMGMPQNKAKFSAPNATSRGCLPRNRKSVTNGRTDRRTYRHHRRIHSLIEIQSQLKRNSPVKFFLQAWSVTTTAETHLGRFPKERKTGDDNDDNNDNDDNDDGDNGDDDETGDDGDDDDEYGDKGDDDETGNDCDDDYEYGDNGDGDETGNEKQKWKG